MARRRRYRRRGPCPTTKSCVCKPRATSKRGYKKCVVSALSRAKFTTPRAAARAFSAAKKHCRERYGSKPAVRRKRGRKRRRRSRARRVPWQTRRQLGVEPGAFGGFRAQFGPKMGRL